MRILFSGTPSFGHLLPMLPLAGAARRGGHEVAVLTNGSMAGAVGDLPVLAAGPTLGDIIAENVRRMAADPKDVDPSDPAPRVEAFAGIRVDLTVREALAAAGAFGPDLIVCEALDFVGPMVAAALGVPWASHEISVPLPEAIAGAMEAKVATRYADRGVIPTARVAYVDPWPDAMQAEGWVAPDDTITLRPQAHSLDAAAPSWSPPTFPGRQDRPLVLVTLGTVVGTVFAAGMPDEVLASLTSQDVNVIVTLGPQGDPDASDVDRARVHPVGFVPLAQLLEGVDLVVSVGGAGTVLGALGRGLPMVLVPVSADQPLIAERVAAMGAATVTGPERVGEAVGEVLTDPSYRAAAADVAGRMGGMNPPEEALRLLLDRVTERASSGSPRRNS